ncbi:hypothetical protein B0T24DRAFT_616928 [Lasiosphaeria ovina]|uniref:Uncharacterized protein n=1 Tax=Lasiosphaeria ovina TaxID=92902 RepID=A0AAE0N9H3_9PEZI|nr:hypothetical protein B0T24DRAFT_616928 [Lasiosphaeria ovina]
MAPPIPRKIKVRGYEYEGNSTLIATQKRSTIQISPGKWIAVHVDEWGKMPKEIDVNLVYKELNRSIASTPSSHILYKKHLPGFIGDDATHYLEQKSLSTSWKQIDELVEGPSIPAFGGPEVWMALMVLGTNNDRVKKQSNYKDTKDKNGMQVPSQLRASFQRLDLAGMLKSPKDDPPEFWKGADWFDVNWRNRHQKQVSYPRDPDMPSIDLNRYFGNAEIERDTSTKSSLDPKPDKSDPDKTESNSSQPRNDLTNNEVEDFNEAELEEKCTEIRGSIDQAIGIFNISKDNIAMATVIKAGIRAQEEDLKKYTIRLEALGTKTLPDKQNSDDLHLAARMEQAEKQIKDLSRQVEGLRNEVKEANKKQDNATEMSKKRKLEEIDDQEKELREKIRKLDEKRLSIK